MNLPTYGVLQKMIGSILKKDISIRTLSALRWINFFFFLNSNSDLIYSESEDCVFLSEDNRLAECSLSV